MNRPDDIPEDVWETVLSLEKQVRTPKNSQGWLYTTEGRCALTAAHAVMAERERCAKIIAAYGDHPDAAVAFVSDEIAVAIRNGQEPEK